MARISGAPPLNLRNEIAQYLSIISAPESRININEVDPARTAIDELAGDTNWIYTGRPLTSIRIAVSEGEAGCNIQGGKDIHD